MHETTVEPTQTTAEAESVPATCVRIFRQVADLKYTEAHFNWTDERLSQEPLEALDVDSLTLLEYVMAVEEAFNIELDEDAVNACENLGDLVKLVMAARNGSKPL
jgi:acyl carrier protein